VTWEIVKMEIRYFTISSSKIRLKSVKSMRKLSHRRLLKLIDVQPTTANINYYKEI